MSGNWAPTPAQNSFMPAPVPVDSTIGALKFAFLRGEPFGDRGGERIDGGRADRADLIARSAARLAAAIFLATGKRQCEGAGQCRASG